MFFAAIITQTRQIPLRSTKVFFCFWQLVNKYQAKIAKEDLFSATLPLLFLLFLRPGIFTQILEKYMKEKLMVNIQYVQSRKIRCVGVFYWNFLTYSVSI